jgi:transposase InsO family protein
MGSRLIKTGRPRTCNISTEESYPSTEPKLGDWRGPPSRSSCWVTKRSSTTARQTHLPAQALQTIPITWLFAVWGLDLVGTLQKAPEGFTHLLVAIDKFSKWIEVRPLNSIRSEQAVAFFTNIIHRFGILNSIITDNGT